MHVQTKVSISYMYMDLASGSTLHNVNIWLHLKRARCILTQLLGGVDKALKLQLVAASHYVVDLLVQWVNAVST